MLTKGDQNPDFVIKRKRKRFAHVDPCLGFYPPSSPPNIQVSDSSGFEPDALAPALESSEIVTSGYLPNVLITDKPENNRAFPSPQPAVTVEDFLRRNLGPIPKRRRRQADLGNHAYPQSWDGDHVSVSEIQFSSSPRSLRKEILHPSVKKNKRSQTKKQKLFTDRLVRAAVLAGVNTDADFQTDLERLLPPPLEFLTLSGDPCPSPIQKPQRRKFVRAKRTASFQPEFPARIQESFEASFASYRPVTLWKPVLQTSHETSGPKHRISNRVFRKSNHTNYAPLPFLMMRDDQPHAIAQEKNALKTTIMKPKPGALAPLLHAERNFLFTNSSRPCAGPPSGKQVRFSSPTPDDLGQGLQPPSPLPVLAKSPVSLAHSPAPRTNNEPLRPSKLAFPGPSIESVVKDCLPNLRLPIAALVTLVSSSLSSGEPEEEEDQLDSSLVNSAAYHEPQTDIKKPMKFLGMYLDKFQETARQAELSLVMNAPIPSQTERARRKIDLIGKQTKCQSSSRNSGSQSVPPSRPSHPLTSLSFASSAKSDGHSRRKLTDYSKRMQPHASSRNLSALGNLPVINTQTLADMVRHAASQVPKKAKGRNFRKRIPAREAGNCSSSQQPPLVEMLDGKINFFAGL